MFELTFTEEQQMLRDMVRDFVTNELKPLAAQIDEQEAIPDHIIKKIAELNDIFRKSFNPAMGQVVCTKSICMVKEFDEIIKNVKSFDTFTKDNNPYGENDFGSFKYNIEGKGNSLIFWKIDYYDKKYLYGCEDKDKIDIEKCKRVLTVMFASEY